MTVKSKKRGRPTGSVGNLSSETIIDTAKALMRQEGKVPSIRALAGSLTVDAMAIYHYFENKNALLEAITTSLIDDIYQPTASDDWENELSSLCKSYLELLEQYSGLLETLLSMKSHGPVEKFRERFLTVIEPLNLNQDKQHNAESLLIDYLHGFALAMRCNQTGCALTPTFINGPLTLYCNALTA
ncbi:TetR/AcrR family transcriptional regulator; helix-turn-helix transcriptional regulator [Enterovibrio sp. ZSDZ35]|uniref:TetR/AcrR family transcriptional regulator helix-turn-helix transcriptional regulator n=1 Tax=Enterovibrio qingdaonensis TaxID=2899818 RepID=A0ABT5QHP2_9GAMM|nr:TetR/AcrR family transcriptional regulator [Enterovibrio sp. ZSDZ35]MDD1780183.1 TetR/AcrR family transcriptional regulator; helix-turn-helix transcriptional regulator [Enterovibrio sp. ZSDZ35]